MPEYQKPWIGVDFDGTLATYEGWKGEGHLGEPIRLMVERVKSWLLRGEVVKIFTARVCPGNDVAVAVAAINEWCMTHLGEVLEVTCVKDRYMKQLWDDRAVSVEHNTGRVIMYVKGLEDA